MRHSPEEIDRLQRDLFRSMLWEVWRHINQKDCKHCQYVQQKINVLDSIEDEDDYEEYYHQEEIRQP